MLSARARIVGERRQATVVLIRDQGRHGRRADRRVDLHGLIRLLHTGLDQGFEDRAAPADRPHAARLIDREIEGADLDVVAVLDEALQAIEEEVEDLGLLVVRLHLVVLSAVAHDVEARIGHVFDRERDRGSVELAHVEAGEIGGVDSGQVEDLALQEDRPRVGAHQGGGQRDLFTAHLHAL